MSLSASCGVAARSCSPDSLFFQAEDGIRDKLATGVQTCALPILVLWDREGGVRRGLAQGAAVYPPPDVQWIEDRFWVWVHYAQGKIARGELFEAIDMLGFVRKRVLGPLALMAAGTLPNGVRRVEEVVQGRAAGLAATLAIHD